VSPRDLIGASWQGLRSNVLRSALTTLGILIGVAAVIVLVAVGNGSARQVNDAISALGTNTLTVLSGFSTGGVQSQRYDLTVDAARALADDVLAPDVKSVSPTVTVSATATADAKSTSISQIVGTYPSYFEASNSPVDVGGYFDNADVTSVAKVVVLGRTPAEDLFGSARGAIGQTVSLNGVGFTVVGVLADKGSGDFGDANSIAIAPLTAVQQSLYGYGPLSSILVQATSADAVDAADAEVTSILNDWLDVADTSNEPFQVLNQSQLLDARTKSNETFTILLGVVAGISLLVGGLGITNIMLVTVTERTREIGVRKALGAPRRAILAQFLVEATALSVAGGVLGVAVGLAVSTVDIIGVDPIVVPSSVLLALGVCLAIGVFFGSYPASRASRLRPVDALRHE
jgi:putative ABC transport system permease protein